MPETTTKTAQTEDSVMESANQRLAEFIVTAPKQHSPEALQRSRRAVLDTIGCMLVGIDEDVTKTVLASVAAWGQGTATVAGSDTTLPPPWAALVNGTSAKSYDFDDWDDFGYTHTTAILLPAILAALCGKSASGFDLFDAHIVGVEAIIRIGDPFNPGHYARGWHATSTIGAIGAAAACARAIGLNIEQTVYALSLATSMAGGTTTQFGTMAKPMHAGLAAKAGLLAATLAANGATAHTDTLDGPVSFTSMMTDASRDDLARSLDKLGKPWAMDEHGLHIKLYPSCGGTHRVIAAALEIRQEHELDPGDIEAIDICVPDYLNELLPYDIPANPIEALFSFPYCVAAAFYWGQAGIDEFKSAAVSNDSVLELARKVSTHTRPSHNREKVFLEGDPDTVAVKTRSGQTLTGAVDVPYGAPPRLADDETVQRKFFDCALRKISTEHASEIRDLVFRADGNWPVAELMLLLRSEQIAVGEPVN